MTQCFKGVTNELLANFRADYPLVNVDRELAKMALWMQSTKGNRCKGTIGFITNWLSRAHPDEHKTMPQESTELSPYLDDYDREYVWKDREHILLMNQASPKE